MDAFWWILGFLLVASAGDASKVEASVEETSQSNAGIKCFVCYSCSRVESSQSLTCQEDDNQCMVRIFHDA